MKQLMFDDHFEIVDEPLSFWKRVEDVPKEVINFMEGFADSLDLCDYFTCPICGKRVNQDFFCPDCLEYPFESFQEEFYSYYVFDVVEKEVFLYRMVEERIISFSGIQRKIRISNAFHVEKNGVTDYCDGIFYDANSFSLKDTNKSHLYVDNLDILKDTIYRYTYLWEAKDYLKDISVTIPMLCFLPFQSNRFDFLMKNGLFQLAFYSLNQLKGKSFIEIFGVEKEFLPFMRENNITYSQLEALRICKSADLELVEYTIQNKYKIEFIQSMVSLSVSEIKNYLESGDHDISDYADYLRFAKELEIDLKDKKYLFPIDLEFDHMVMQEELLYRNDPKIEENITFLSNVLTFNRYEDSEYVIFPAPSVDSMFDEAKQQDNCLVSYCEMYSENDTQIYFMREKSNLAKSFVTIEVKDCMVVQARTRFNKKPSPKIRNIIKEWEKTLLPVEKE